MASGIVMASGMVMANGMVMAISIPFPMEEWAGLLQKSSLAFFFPLLLALLVKGHHPSPPLVH